MFYPIRPESLVAVARPETIAALLADFRRQPLRGEHSETEVAIWQILDAITRDSEVSARLMTATGN